MSENWMDAVRVAFQAAREGRQAWPQDSLGDAHEPAVEEEVIYAQPSSNGHAPAAAFAQPIPASQLKRAPAKPWLWRGYLGKGDVALFSALWKAGKTTLLTHLLRALEGGGKFCGLEVVPSKVLYVTEEAEGRWAERVEQVGIRDHVEFVIRPFKVKPRWADWQAWLVELRKQVERSRADLLVIDTIAYMWSVRDENDASQVQSALQPLHDVTRGDVALLLAHHNRKSDGEEATAARGSGALMGFVDTIIELRRYMASDKNDCRRVLTAYGRDDETPRELVVELAEGTFSAIGDRQEVSAYSLRPVIAAALPNTPPGITTAELLDAWPEDAGQPAPGRDRLGAVLRKGTEQGWWHAEGEGRRGSPRRYSLGAAGS